MQNLIHTESLPWIPFEAPVPGFRSQSRDFNLPLERLSAHLELLPPAALSAPLHHHLLEEEAFFLLSGELTLCERDPQGARRERLLRPGELALWPSGCAWAHQFRNDGELPAHFLALSNRVPGDLCFYPNTSKLYLRSLPEVGRFESLEFKPPKEGPLPALLDPSLLSEQEQAPGCLVRDLSQAGGARQLSLSLLQLAPGTKSGPLKWHSLEEELIYILEGQVRLRQWRGGRDALKRPSFQNPQEELRLMGPGDLAFFSPKEPLAHQLCAEREVKLLRLREERPGDLCLFPELGKLSAPLIQLSGRFQPADYWAGES